MSRIRIAMTISGAVSLGAFEGGALAALLTGLQALPEDGDRPVVVDVMGGASAGSMTALLAAWVLLQGADPVKFMHEAWVAGDAMDALRAHDTSAPLSAAELTKLAARLFEPVSGPARAKQRSKIRVAMALASLRGFSYTIPSLENTTPIEAATYLDWQEFTFDPGVLPSAFTEPKGRSAVEFSLASGANALGFPPVLMDRAAERTVYEKNGVRNFPDTNTLWYTDGGTIDNEPVGRTIGIANELDGDAGAEDQRLHLLIHPHPAAPESGWAWASREHPPTWTHTLTRALHIGMTQSIYDDLRRMEKANSRLKWRDAFVAALRSWLEGVQQKDLASYDELVNLLEGVVHGIEGDKATLRAEEQRAAPPTPDSATGTRSASELLADVVNRVAGLVDKRPVVVEVVSPELVAAEGQPVEELLAGEFLAHFGGFLEEDLRLSDFVLGYRSMQRWMEDGWERNGLDGGSAQVIRDAAADRFDPTWKEAHAGDKSLGSLGWKSKVGVARLMLHVGHVVEHDLRHWDEQQSR